VSASFRLPRSRRRTTSPSGTSSCSTRRPGTSRASWEGSSPRSGRAS
jgi:hypothetical protein